jgi:hypothetical protein
MEVLQFVVLSAVNLGLILFIIRKWSLFSAEGLCFGYLGMMVLTDNVELVFHYLVSPEILPLGYGEFGFRIYPTFVHIVGLIVLIASLLLFNARPKPVVRQLNATETLRLRNIGIAIAACGFVLTGVGIYLVGALSPQDFYAKLSTFRTDVLPFGGFWYRGADIAVFGLALTLPSLQRKIGRLVLALVLMMFVSFFLRTNKGGLEEPIVWGAYVIYIYDRAFFQSLLKFRIIALACAISLAGMGLKGWLLPWALHRAAPPPQTVENLLQMAAATVATRWGDDGVYRGYCQFVNSLPAYLYVFEGHRVGHYTLVGWLPRLVYPNKPEHPFQGIGFMINSDFRAYANAKEAVTFIGSVFADDEYTSMVIYLPAVAWFISMLRRVSVASREALHWHVAYVLFTMFGGVSSEGGIIGIFDTLVLAFGSVTAAYFAIWLTGVRKSSGQGRVLQQTAPAAGQPNSEFAYSRRVTSHL